MTDLSPDSHDAFYFSRSDLTDAEKMTIFKAKIEKSLASADRGDLIPAEKVFKDIKSKLAMLQKQAS
jgi:predicted transcriptional regulator